MRFPGLCLAVFALTSSTNTVAFSPATTTSKQAGLKQRNGRFGNNVIRHMGATMVEAPVRSPETSERVNEVRERARLASVDAANAKGCAVQENGNEWWRQPLDEMDRNVSTDRPLRVVIAGGGVAGLVAASACHSKGMEVAIFEQASQYAPYGGPIQIQSNALRALERINPKICDEIRKAGTITADRVSGLKIGYKKGVFLNLGPAYEKGDWLVRFDTLQPALQAGLYPTVVVDRPVIQQILMNNGIPEGTVRIKSRIASYEELGPGKGVKVRKTNDIYIYLTFRKKITFLATIRPSLTSITLFTS